MLYQHEYSGYIEIDREHISQKAIVQPQQPKTDQSEAGKRQSDSGYEK